jgi:hypothetical protein
MRTLLLLYLGLSSVTLAADAPGWLATRAAPPCSTKVGVRASRSELVQFGSISASIAAQSSREETGECTQSASLWMTGNGVSHQFELSGAAAYVFSIVDFAPDASAILLFREKAFAAPGEDTAPEAALLAFGDAGPRWQPVMQFAGWKPCAGILEPQGFLSPRAILFRASPPAAPAALHACVQQTRFVSLDLATRKLALLPASTVVRRNGRLAGGPLLSCQSDPDLVGACYRMRGRVSVSSDGVGMRVWQVGTAKVMDLAEGMLPDELAEQVTPAMRVYANMLVCPVHANGPKAPDTVCIESAGDFRLEAAGAQVTGTAGGGVGAVH